MVLEIGWFSTGRDKAARDLLRTIYNGINTGRINARISFVFCNREFGESKESDRFLRMVLEYGIDLICCSSKDFQSEMRRQGGRKPDILEKWREKYDHEITKRLCQHRSDLTILAGYMLVLSRKMCEMFDIINLHPAAPGGPSGTWQEVIWELIESKADTSGVMIHLVTSNLDEGPPVAYCTFPVRGPAFDRLWEDFFRKIKAKSLFQIQKEEGEGNGLFMKIREEGFKRELPLLFETVCAFADGRVWLENKKVFFENKIIEGGLCLEKEVETDIFQGKFL